MQNCAAEAHVAIWPPRCVPIAVLAQAMIKAPKQDLPAFWSVRTHGQPFNDERLAGGASNFYRLAQPAGLNASSPGAVGPATMQQAALRKWVGRPGLKDAAGCRAAVWSSQRRKGGVGKGGSSTGRAHRTGLREQARNAAGSAA